ncbi:hypothetical protein [Aeromicrobium endophyticum]|uniref:hypothetical protein n=1 Tax=Aeromicrobium endophyticum TaxID=2292704 RepID=UPI001314E1F8|nr:hypothetical protein [Aeromicrobium endophyticum]
MRSEKDDAFRAYVTQHRADLVRTATLLPAGDALMDEQSVHVTDAAKPSFG